MTENTSVGQRLPTGHQFAAPGLDQAQMLSSSEHMELCSQTLVKLSQWEQHS